MKKTMIILLGLVDVICVGAIFYLLFSTPALGKSMLSILLPTVIAFAAAILIGRLTSPGRDGASHGSPDARLGHGTT